MKIYNISRRYLLAVIVSFLFVVVVSVVFVCSYSTQPAAAQDKTTKGLTLSPLRSELNIAPGTSLDGTLTVTNSTDKPMLVSLSAEEFSMINQQYDYAFTVESNLAKWVTFNSNEVNLAVGESKKISFTVGAPLSAEPGGRYISLFASTDTGIQDGGVSSRQRIASLLYITVLGDVSRVGHLLSIASPWAVSGNSIWSAIIQNTGTTHFRSRYNVQTMNLWGGVVASSQGDALILPGTVRSVSDALPLPQPPGIYKIVYMIGLGDTPSVTETRFVLYATPLSTVAVVAVVVVLYLWLLRRRSSKH